MPCPDLQSCPKFDKKENKKDHLKLSTLFIRKSTMNIPIAPGVFDILPKDPQEPWKNSYLWSYVERIIRKTANDFGFKEIRTPIFERTELFARGVGETSDIVSKEMYTFEDKGQRSMTLRPEGTAPVMRAFIENQLHNTSSVHKLFYIGPMFRYERTQAGRYRQHHQFGVEAIGIKSPEQDAEVIDLLYTLYTRLGLSNLKVNLNSIGDLESRLAFKKALQDYYKSFFDALSQDSKVRFEKNPLRILDSKDPGDITINENAPSILDYLNEESRTHFEEVKRLLLQLKIPFEINPKLVRGLDYYNKTVFEITSGELGAQNSVGGGGRYDGLIKTLGGPDLPSFGFGTGLERVIQTMIKQNAPLPKAEAPTLFIIPLGEQSRQACFSILHDIRSKGVSSEMDFSGRKLNKVMQYANEIGAKYVAVVGETELANNEVELKEMATGEKIKAPLTNLGRILTVENSSDAFIELWSEMSKPFQNPAEADFFLKRINQTIDNTQKLSENLQQAMKKIEEIL